MSAIRLARGFTRRDRVIKFAGCYHGHADPFLASAGSGLATLGIPSSPGVPSGVTADTIVVPYNDIEAVAEAVALHGEGLAAILVEPIAGNMGCVPPAPGFLEALRALCDASGALLVFDEVISGFRVARGGAQEVYGVNADLTVLGKIAGGGLPLAAFGGRGDVLERLAPAGDVYQAGTLSGNPLATAAGLAVLRRLRDPGVYDELERRGARLEAGLAPFGRVQRVGAMLTLFAGRAEPVTGFEELDTDDVRPALPRPARARDLRRAEPVRMPVPVARTRRRRDRPDDRGGGRCPRYVTPSSPVPATRARSGRSRSATRPTGSRCSRRSRPTPSRSASRRCTRRTSSTTGTPRLFAVSDLDEAVLLGDYLYAHGLVRVADAGGVDAVAAMAELISRCAALQGRRRGR